MSWLDEQIHKREVSDNKDFADAIDSIANAVMGRRLQEALNRKEIFNSAIGEILHYYGFKEKTELLPDGIEGIEEQIEYCVSPYGIRTRKVHLEKGWYKYGIGAMIGTLKADGTAVALIPSAISGYKLVNTKTGKSYRLNKKMTALLDEDAICFYKPFPNRPLEVNDLLQFMMKSLSCADIVFYFLFLIICALLGLMTPIFTKWLFGDVLELGNQSVLNALAAFMICFGIGRVCIVKFKDFINMRISVKQDIAMQAAVINRVLNLPTSVFKNYTTGELYQGIAYVQELSRILVNTITMVCLTAFFSLIYIWQIKVLVKELAVPALVLLGAMTLLSLITIYMQMGLTRKKMQYSAKTTDLTLATINGIQKIKLAGAEKRVFSRFAKCYSEEIKLQFNPPLFLKMSSTIELAIAIVGMLVIYAEAVKNSVSVADYLAFNSGYGMVSSAFMSVTSIASMIASVKPILSMVKPILAVEPEHYDDKERITKLKGGIELSHITFRYNDSMPCVIDDLSLRIAPGEYVAIVGPTGCGKSTLLRLMLGFETPQKGSVIFDRKDLTRLNLDSLRKNVGVVMQDNKLFFGDIFSNIIVTAPDADMDRAYEAAKKAAIADDIDNMPMGMNTVISEGQGGISGGQRQRIAIARALISNPKILMLDEATSALDNIAQKQISDAIDKLNCTRVVIAHRLSTIKNADRIIYLEHGRIQEEGTFEELMAKKGLFAELIKNQQI